MRLAATWASNGPPGARFRMPKSSPEASTRVIAISMVRRTKKRVIGIYGSANAPAKRLQRTAPRTRAYATTLAQIPLEDVPRVPVGGELGPEVDQPVRRRGHVGA